jgi:hypothetical protein
MKKLKLNPEDLSVESFASGRTLSFRGTVQGRDLEDQLEPIGETGGDTYDVFCGGEDYAATNRSRSTCPCNWSCLRNCGTIGS